MSDSSYDNEAMRELKFKMATELAHELRTPLGGIIGINELMMMSELNPEQKQFADTIQDSAKSMLQLLTDAVELARLEAEKVAPKLAPFNPRTTLEECKFMLRKYLKVRQIELQIKEDQLPESVNGDSQLLLQVLTSIVLAASKYVESGVIELDVHSGAKSTETEEIQFKFTLPPNTVNRSGQPVFAQFVNESDPISRFDATWLRLTIAQKILGLMHAKTSAVGNCLTVKIDFHS